MKSAALALFGWLVPGGAYLILRRYAHFAIFAVLVTATFGAGLALQGSLSGPQAADLQGLDPFTTFIFRAGGFAKALAGAPYLLVFLTGSPHSFLDGRLHEYGTTLLVMAGLFNVLAISNALETRKEQP